MAPQPDTNAVNPLGTLQPERVTLYEMFPRHVRVLAALPGEVSEFNETGFGHEWRCECRLGACSFAGADSPGKQWLKLHFSLLDMKGHIRPSAVLYLVREGEGRGVQQRLLIPLEDLDDTHEILNRHLGQQSASIDALETASQFIGALHAVRDDLGSEVDWVAAGN